MQRYSYSTKDKSTGKFCSIHFVPEDEITGMPGAYYYKKNGDVDSERNLSFLETNLFPKVFDYVWFGHKSILDVGSGNGRVNSIYRRYFSEIYNIDIEKIDPRFDYSNVASYSSDFLSFEFYTKFDVISFIYSFYTMSDKYSTLQKSKSLLTPKGTIIILDDTDWETYDDRQMSYKLDPILKDLDMCRVEHTTEESPYDRISVIREI